MTNLQQPENFSYLYCTKTQSIVQYSSEHKEQRRIFVPFKDLEKIALLCWSESLDKLMLDKE